jgi:hypothetical protein
MSGTTINDAQRYAVLTVPLVTEDAPLSDPWGPFLRCKNLVDVEE